VLIITASPELQRDFFPLPVPVADRRQWITYVSGKHFDIFSTPPHRSTRRESSCQERAGHPSLGNPCRAPAASSPPPARIHFIICNAVVVFAPIHLVSEAVELRADLAQASVDHNFFILTASTRSRRGTLASYADRNAGCRSAANPRKGIETQLKHFAGYELVFAGAQHRLRFHQIAGAKLVLRSPLRRANARHRWAFCQDCRTHNAALPTPSINAMAITRNRK